MLLNYTKKIPVMYKKKFLEEPVGFTKITYEYIWRERETDEGSEYFLHTVPMGYIHRHTITWAQCVGHCRRLRSSVPPVGSRGRIMSNAHGRGEGLVNVVRREGSTKRDHEAF